MSIITSHLLDNLFTKNGCFLAVMTEKKSLFFDRIQTIRRIHGIYDYQLARCLLGDNSLPGLDSALCLWFSSVDLVNKIFRMKLLYKLSVCGILQKILYCFYCCWQEVKSGL